jgi:hypothetical protein
MPQKLSMSDPRSRFNQQAGQMPQQLSMSDPRGTNVTPGFNNSRLTHAEESRKRDRRREQKRALQAKMEAIQSLSGAGQTRLRTPQAEQRGQLPPGFTMNATGEIIPASPTNAGPAPLQRSRSDQDPIQRSIPGIDLTNAASAGLAGLQRGHSIERSFTPSPVGGEEQAFRRVVALSRGIIAPNAEQQAEINQIMAQFPNVDFSASTFAPPMQRTTGEYLPDTLRVNQPAGQAQPVEAFDPSSRPPGTPALPPPPPAAPPTGLN